MFRSAAAAAKTRHLEPGDTVITPLFILATLRESYGRPAVLSLTVGGVAPFQTKTNMKDGSLMVWVPTGPFRMGVDRTPMDSERRPQANSPKHEVTLDGYWIYRNLVMVKQYREFCRAVGIQMPPAPAWGWRDDHPMVNVSWPDASKYASWAGGALPTEAQWEKAARGTDGRLYPWGDKWDARCCVHSIRTWGDAKNTLSVGSNPGGASPYGLLDMAGNVWQWCSDWFAADYYRTSPTRNPIGAPMSTDSPTGKIWSLFKVVRGGAWCLCDPKDFLATNRDWACDPNMWENDIGFRCVVAGP